MKVAVIGAGFAGLSCAFYLAKEGVDVSIYEQEDKPGGLATGFRKIGWKWPLEKHYHHWFVSDHAIKKLAKEINYKTTFTRPKTSTFIKGEISQLDSPTSLIFFKYLSLLERIRTGATLAFLKFTPFWKPLEKITSKSFLIKTMGKSTWKILWQPLFKGKFDKHADEIAASWFWARIKKRSPSLGYPEGGFENFAKSVARQITKWGGKIYYQTRIEKIEKEKGGFKLKVEKLNKKLLETKSFDKVICTLPFPIFLKIAPKLPSSYKKKLSNITGIGAINLILRLKKPFLTDGTYWLNINGAGFPFLAIVEHTNFMKKSYYAGEHIVYVGKYLSPTHKYFPMADEELFATYEPYLKKINPFFKDNLIGYDVFRAPFAQPIIPLNYSKVLPPLDTPIEGLFLATIQQVYPWDRGTNYAVEMGKKVARLVNNKI